MRNWHWQRVTTKNTIKTSGFVQFAFLPRATLILVPPYLWTSARVAWGFFAWLQLGALVEEIAAREAWREPILSRTPPQCAAARVQSLFGALLKFTSRSQFALFQWDVPLVDPPGQSADQSLLLPRVQSAKTEKSGGPNRARWVFWLGICDRSSRLFIQATSCSILQVWTRYLDYL